MSQLHAHSGPVRRLPWWVGGVAFSSASELTRGRPGFGRDDHGATAVEYALMASLIAVVIVVCVAAFGTNVSKLFLVPSSVFTP